MIDYCAPGVRLFRAEYLRPAAGSYPSLLELESIGDDRKEAWRKMRKGRDVPAHMISRFLRDPATLAPVWVARILGITAEGRPVRRFVRGNKSYERANGVGSRGVYFAYLLHDGPIYEIQEDLDRRRTRRGFWRFAGGERRSMTRDEVLACLAR